MSIFAKWSTGAILITSLIFNFIIKDVYAQDDRPFWTEKSSWVEGDILYTVGVASNVEKEEEGRDIAYKNGISEIANYIHVTDLGGVPVETQMTYTEKLKDGRFNVYRLLKADNRKLLELKKRQLERGVSAGKQEIARNEQELKDVKLQLQETQTKLIELTDKQAIMQKDAEINKLKQKEADLERKQQTAEQQLKAKQKEITELKKPKNKVKSSDEIVVFNVKTKTFHCAQCNWAVKCTRNCIKVPLSEAVKMGGKPCKTCGGKCTKQ